jgi:hypothetical protein
MRRRCTAATRVFARDLARQNIDAFAGGDFVAIINNAGGCGASLKGYDHLLADDPAYAERAHDLWRKSRTSANFSSTTCTTHPPAGCRRASPTSIRVTCATGKRSASSRARCCAAFPVWNWSS